MRCQTTHTTPWRLRYLQDINKDSMGLDGHRYKFQLLLHLASDLLFLHTWLLHAVRALTMVQTREALHLLLNALPATHCFHRHNHLTHSSIHSLTLNYRLPICHVDTLLQISASRDGRVKFLHLPAALLMLLHKLLLSGLPLRTGPRRTKMANRFVTP